MPRMHLTKQDRAVKGLDERVIGLIEEECCDGASPQVDSIFNEIMRIVNGSCLKSDHYRAVLKIIFSEVKNMATSVMPKIKE